MVGLGAPEIIILVIVMGLFWVIPIAAAVWALVTLHRIRSGQEVIRLRLELLERTIQRSAEH